MMIEIDLYDFIEDIKYEMTEYEILDEKTIKDWEKRARNWIEEHDDKKKRIVKLKNRIIVKVKDEEVAYDLACDIAEKYDQACQSSKTDEYWSKFSLLS